MIIIFELFLDEGGHTATFTMNELRTVFIIHLVGSTISFIVFLVEKYLYNSIKLKQLLFLDTETML